MNSVISYQPTSGLSYDPQDEKYWDKAALEGEVRRVFEICHGCRMCFKYCDSFSTLFKLIDERAGGEVLRLTHQDTESVMDHCFQCKLCEVQCPYTPRDGHEFQLDFPKLVHRHHALRFAGQDPGWREGILSDPDRAGRLARATLGLANTLNRSAIHRWFMEKLLGIHREKQLPEFAAETFERSQEKRGRLRSTPDPSGQEAVLFQTCYVQNNEPQIGDDALAVLDQNQIKTSCVAGLSCCGMPAWESGDLARLRASAKNNLDRLLPFVEAGAKVLVINPTCGMMMRKEYPTLLGEEDRPRAAKLAEAVRDVAEYVFSIRQEPRFSRAFKSTPGESVAYHAPCHLRAQRIGFKGRDLLRLIPGVTASTTMECCGHDGTYAMRVESFEASKRVGQKAFDSLKENSSEVWATECPLAAIQFEQHAGKKALHPLSILARAYKSDGFPTPIREDEAK